MTSESSAAVVYGTLKEAQQAAAPAGVSIAPIPSFDLYKVAREEELAAYRSVCRVLAMHHGQHLPKAQQRMLEDLRESWCISEDRGSIEQEVASADPIVSGVRQSGILHRRAEFFDGVEDVELTDVSGVRAADDGQSMYVPANKMYRAEANTTGSNNGPIRGTAANAAASAPRANAAKRKQVLHSITKVGKEVEQAANELLYASSAHVQAEAKRALSDRREMLLQLRQELADML